MDTQRYYLHRQIPLILGERLQPHLAHRAASATLSINRPLKS